MALKTFNLDEEIYRTYSAYCRENGISMSKRVEMFIKDEVGKINDKTKESKTLSDEEHPMAKYT